MTGITIDIKGLDAILAKLDKASENVERAVEKGLTAVAYDAMALAQASILRGPKTGRIYKRETRSHQASAPGEAPANDLGFLAQSMRVDVVSRTAVDLKNSASYAIHLEYGTRKMAPRPFMRPAAELAGKYGSDKIESFVSAALKED